MLCVFGFIIVVIGLCLYWFLELVINCAYIKISMKLEIQDITELSPRIFRIMYDHKLKLPKHLRNKEFIIKSIDDAEIYAFDLLKWLCTLNKVKLDYDIILKFHIIRTKNDYGEYFGYQNGLLDYMGPMYEEYLTEQEMDKLRITIGMLS